LLVKIHKSLASTTHNHSRPCIERICEFLKSAFANAIGIVAISMVLVGAKQKDEVSN
jgi:hypothetical protein